MTALAVPALGHSPCRNHNTRFLKHGNHQPQLRKPLNKAGDPWYLAVEMSDMGALSYEYARAHDLAEKLRAILRSQDGETRRRAQTELAPLISGLLALMDPLRWGDAGSLTAVEIPPGLARQLRSRELQGREISLELSALASSLREQRREPGRQDIKLLQELLQETESEISRIWRRMVHR